MKSVYIEESKKVEVKFNIRHLYFSRTLLELRKNNMKISNNLTTTNINRQFSPEVHNHSSVYCQLQRDIYNNLDLNAKVTLTILFSVTGILGSFLNIVVVFAIHKTNQLAVQSIRLFRILSILDTFNSVVNFFHLKVLLVPSYLTSCAYIYVLSFILYFGLYNSLLMVFVVALDRFLHVSYLQEYSRVFTAIRFKLSIAIALLLALYQSCATAISSIFIGPGVAGKFTFHLNIFGFFSIIFFYAASLVKLRRHSQAHASVSNTQRSILRITALYFYFYLIILIPLLLFQILNNWTDILSDLGDSGRNLVGIITFSIPAFIGIVNALAFLWINRKSREWVKSFFRSSRNVNLEEANIQAQPAKLAIRPMK